jgi:hypothetical protein
MSNESHRGHGEIGRREQPFTRLIPAGGHQYDIMKLQKVAELMMLNTHDPIDDGPDAEENLFIPAGYTYFGQFVDHDLTLDVTSTLNPEDKSDGQNRIPTNLRTPRFDLDCLYGSGPLDQPFMYDREGLKLLLGEHPRTMSGVASDFDLARSSEGRAIIGDKRNDENSIVNQIQHAFILFHNKTIDALRTGEPDPHLFERAQQAVRWTYQRILLDDFLPRIINQQVLKQLKEDVGSNNATDDSGYKLFTLPRRTNLPREFVAAAYRYGHSGVRTGYRLNGRPGPNNGTALPIFINGPSANNPVMSLVGFDPLPPEHVIDDWGRFFPLDALPAGMRTAHNDNMKTVEQRRGGEGKVRLQYAYKLDPTLVDPLATLPAAVATSDELPPTVRPKDSTGPSLALLNLLRGSIYELPSGETVATQLKAKILNKHELAVRRTDDSGGFFFTSLFEVPAIGDYFNDDTPLWFYILAEAQLPVFTHWQSLSGKDPRLSEDELLGKDPGDDAIAGVCGGTQLGEVGGRIVGEVFYGLLQSDASSVLYAPNTWRPAWPSGKATMGELLRYVGLPITDPQHISGPE